MTPQWCCAALSDSLALSALRYLFGSGWFIWISEYGTWWAAGGTEEQWRTGTQAHGAITIGAGNPQGLAARIRERA